MKEVGLFADGTAVKIVGAECWRLLKQKELIEGMIRVDTDEICAAIRDVFEGESAVSNHLPPPGLRRSSDLTA